MNERGKLWIIVKSLLHFSAVKWEGVGGRRRGGGKSRLSPLLTVAAASASASVVRERERALPAAEEREGERSISSSFPVQSSPFPPLELSFPILLLLSPPLLWECEGKVCGGEGSNKPASFRLHLILFFFHPEKTCSCPRGAKKKSGGSKRKRHIFSLFLPIQGVCVSNRAGKTFPFQFEDNNL